MQQRYWFPAKTYGWGWGVPATWEGWLVLAAYIVLAAAIGFLFPPETKTAAFCAGIAGLSVLLIGICWLKGEPPGWRWGK